MIGVIFVTVCLGLRVVLGYPGGAPSSACVYLLPKHGYPHFEPQASISPFELVFSSATYSPGQEMEVAIVSEASPFNGWLLQVRRVDTDMVVGQFVSSPVGSRIVSCNGQNNSITHSNSYMFPNTTLRAKWIAPQEDVGNLILIGTVLKDYSTFWGPLESNEIPFVPDAPSQDTPTTQKPTISSTTTITPSTSTSSPTTNSPSTTTVSPTTATQATTTTIQPPITTTTTKTTPQPTFSNTTTQPTTTSSTTTPPRITSSTTTPPRITSSTTTQPTASSSTTQKVTTKLPSTTTTPSPTTSTKSPNQPMNSTTQKPVSTSTKQAQNQSTETEPSTQENSSSETVPSAATKDDSKDTSGNGSGSVTSQNILLLLSLWALCWCK